MADNSARARSDCHALDQVDPAGRAKVFIHGEKLCRLGGWPLACSRLQESRVRGDWEGGNLSLSHVSPSLSRLPHYMRAWNRLDDPSIEKGWPGLASRLAEPTFCFTYGSLCFVRKSRKGWLAHGSLVRRVTLLSRTSFLYMNEVSLVKGAEITELYFFVFVILQGHWLAVKFWGVFGSLQMPLRWRDESGEEMSSLVNTISSI